MNSVLTNTSAMNAILNLNNTQQSLSTVQNQISTGMKVSSAKDDAAYWSIATNMRTTNNDLDAVSSALNLGNSVLGTATSALGSMLTVLQKIQQDVIKAQTTGTDKTAIQKDITQLQNQLTSTISTASFNGVNMLDGTSMSVKVVSGVTGSGATLASSSMTVTGYNFSTGSTGIDGADTLDVTTATDNQVTNLGYIGTAIANVQAASEAIGATQKNIDIQSTFVSALSTSITSGIGSLVDADMNVASTRLQALQTQQQLGIQSLSIANQNSQLILKLFQG